MALTPRKPSVQKLSLQPCLPCPFPKCLPNQDFTQNRKENQCKDEERKQEQLVNVTLLRGKLKMTTDKGQSYKLSLFHPYKSKAIPKKLWPFLKPC